jgi:hypothetical protein
MLRKLRSRLTFANVTSLLALFVALGGTSYAVKRLNGRDLENRSVPGKKLKRNSVTGKEVRESKLKTVPNADKVDGFDVSPLGAAGALVPLGADGKFPASVGAIGPQGAQGETGAKGDRGDPGTPAGAFTKIAYLADVGAATSTIYENDSFRLTAGCDNTVGPNVVVRPKSDHGAFAQSATASNTTNGLYFQNPDTSVASPTVVQFFNLPEEAGTLTYLAPGGSQVTTMTYLVNFLFATRDCAFVANVVTL